MIEEGVMRPANATIEKTRPLMPLACERPGPQPAAPKLSDPLPPEPVEPPPDLFPIPKLPDERTRDVPQERSDVKA
jgi:hypothetical protein